MKPRKRKDLILLVLLIFLLFVINYPFLDSTLENFLKESGTEKAFIVRVIDGDTVVLDTEERVRLLGINAPEKGEKYYLESKEFLEDSVLNKTVTLKFGKDRQDRYGRTLAYILIGKDNINLQLVENGLANYYFPSGKDVYYNDFKKAWEKCIEKNINLCESSNNTCSQCIKLKSLSHKEDKAVFYNSCGFQCNLNKWTIKDEGRKTFTFHDFVLMPGREVEVKTGNNTNTESILYWRDETYVWTRTGDTLFLRDELGKLVLWRGY